MMADGRRVACFALEDMLDASQNSTDCGFHPNEGIRV